MATNTIEDEIRILLGDASTNYTAAEINLAYRMALTEIEEYCRREADATLTLIAEEIAVIKLLRSNTEGLAAQSFSGVSESYIDGYPAEIQNILINKRKLKTV